MVQQATQPQPKPQKPLSYTALRRLRGAKQHEYVLVSDFKYGYRNREDKTNMPVGVLVEGSKNVLTNVSDRIQIRKGYSLDGPASTDAYPIESGYTFTSHLGFERNLRAYSPTSTTGKLEYRYVDSSNVVTWRTLMSSLTSTAFNFAAWWDTTELLREILMVNGTANVFEWNGAVTTYASSTSTTITKQGTNTWAQDGFYSKTFSTIGSGTSQFDITNPSGTTFRYTWDGNGTDPAITAASVPVGTYILVRAQNFNTANNGLFLVTGSGANYFEVTNASGVAEVNKTIGTGFIYVQYTKIIIINGIAYAYTGGETTLTLTGVVPDPTGAGIAVGAIIHQGVITTPNSAMTSLLLTRNDLIGTFQRQLYLGSFLDQTIYVSKTNNYKDYTTSQLNKTGFGNTLSLDSAPISINALENAVTISAGKNQWYQVTLANSTYTDTTNPAAPVVYDVTDYTVDRLKTTANQAAQSQGMVSALKNDLVFISNEPTMDTLGRVEQILGTVQTANFSDSIKLDFDAYDFTGAHIYYNKFFIYLAIPANGVVRIYNIVKKYWEAPQTLPITVFYTVDGDLYGHSSITSESYQLFNGRADRVDPSTNPLGHPIPAVAAFSFQNYGTRNIYKNFNEYYVEGYISSNTTLNAGIQYDLDGCSTNVYYPIVGSDTSIVCIPSSGASLGKAPLGFHPLGGDLITENAALPPKFRVIKTFPSVDFFENQFTFYSNDINSNWEVLAFGPAIQYSSTIPTSIKQ